MSNRKLSALVVNPYVTDFKLYDEWMHPLGLYFLMDILSYNDIEVYYFNFLKRDMKFTSKFGTGKFEYTYITKPSLYSKIKRRYKRYGCSVDTFESYLKNLSKIDIVFVGSMMTYWVPGFIETVNIISQYLPDKPIVCGGISAILLRDYLKEKIPDLFIYDRSLLTEGNKISISSLQSLNLPENPSILTGLMQSEKHFHGPIILSFGCPFNCSYCASKILQPERIRRNIETIKKEILFLYERGVVDFAFYDDALLLDKEDLLLPLLNWIKKEGIKISLHTPNGIHLRYVSESLLELMKEAGFTTLRFGYESGKKEYQSHVSFKANREMLREKLCLVKKFEFMDVGVYVMAGLPSSTPADVIEEMKFINACGIVVKPVFLSPVPETELFNYYSKIFPELKKDPLWHNDTFFITQLREWGEEGVEIIREVSKDLNLNSYNIL